MAHICDALVVCCIDFRFQKIIRNWTDTHLNGKFFDFVGFAGSTKDLDTVMKQVTISKKLHHVKQIILMHHEDCGAYGKESTPDNHARDLRKAQERITQKYPDVEVALYYLHLNGTIEPVV